jgi:uncharacterized protein YcbX
MARIAELTVYPIKGCAGTSSATAVVAPAGLEHDRSFMVTDEDGGFRSQRRHPGLALIRPQISDLGDRMTLHHRDHPACPLDVQVDGPRRDVTLFERPYRGIDQGDEAAEWLSAVLGEPSRLVRVPPDHDRVSDGRTPGTVGYADSGAILLLSTSSLTELNRRIAARTGTGLPMNRFRPNLVIEGWDEPHTEDRIRRIQIGDVVLGYAKLAVRCVVTTVDQARGVKAGPEPLRTLADYRRTTGGVAFGAKFAVVQGGKLGVGDEIEITEWGSTEL